MGYTSVGLADGALRSYCNCANKGGQMGATLLGADEVDLGPLPNLLGYALRRAQISVFQDFYASFASINLRPAEFSVLLVIDRNPGLPQRQVGDALNIKPPNFAVLMGRLVDRGLAERRASSSRRAVALHLTPAGEALLTQAMLLLEQHEQHCIDRLGEARRRQLLDLLHDLA